MKTFDKRYHPPGTPPGTLTKQRQNQQTEVIRLHKFNSEFLQETDQPVLSQSISATADTGVWLDISGMDDPEKIRHIGAVNSLHPLALEDILNSGQRPKIDYFDPQAFIVLNLPCQGKNNEIVIEQISLFADQNRIISFCQGDGQIFTPIRAWLQKPGSRLRNKNVNYLLYVLMDTVIDAAFPILEALSERLEHLEEQILLAPEKSQLRILHEMKRELLLLRKALWPQREVLNRLVRDETSLVTPENRVYFSDCYDHAIQILDLIETYREMLNGLLDLYMSGLNNRMNDIMRVLTIIATIFIPLTFLVGVYGMNFKNMPELSWTYGYPLLWGVMLAVGWLMLWIFRRNHWL